MSLNKRETRRKRVYFYTQNIHILGKTVNHFVSDGASRSTSFENGLLMIMSLFSQNFIPPSMETRISTQITNFLLQLLSNLEVRPN